MKFGLNMANWAGSPDASVMADLAMEAEAAACWQGKPLRHRGKYYWAAADPDQEGELVFTPGAYQNRQIPVWVVGNVLPGSGRRLVD